LPVTNVKIPPFIQKRDRVITNTKNKKSEFEKISEELSYKKKNGWEGITTTQRNTIFNLAEKYKHFLNHGKTEREALRYIEKCATNFGYVNIEKAKDKDKKLFLNFDNVAGTLAFINDSENFEEGFLMVGAHIDTPRLDIKGMPLYEAQDMAYMKTHYYGGIKKYQWVTKPLALHGVIVLENGTRIDVIIGEDDNDPVFTINDLLPHLAKDQMNKNARTVIEGESLNILVGSIPYKFKKEKNAIKIAILSYLHEKYGIKEEDFISAELQLVPAGNARDVGFDRSFVGAHGQDDRICSYAGMQALFDTKQSKKNLIMMFFDKEEIGSKGNAGANSNILERMVNNIIRHYGKGDYNTLIKALENTKFLSADVNVGIDPEWVAVTEKMNSGKIGYGVCLTKFTGSRGKSGSNEAHAEFVAECRRAFNKEKVLWQSAELGKVDQGGGGTIAAFIAEYGMDVIDCGTPVLSMHSPFEISSKVDLYHTYKAYKAFYKHC
jgi:aspartyl aminopeptidase